MPTTWPPSPYRPGNGIDPPYLGDREEQIDAVRTFLRDPRHPRNVLITGLRGVGKTVLLNHMQGEAEAAGWLVVDREFSEPDAEPPAFANAVLTDVNRALRRLSLSVRLKERAGLLLQTAIDSVGALAVSYGEFKVSVDTRRRRSEPARRLDDDLREALMRICELCQKSEHKGLVLRYDEFHVVRERSGSPTLSALLSATSAVQQKNLPLMLMLCGLPQVVDNLSRSKSYSERMFLTQELGNLRPPEDRAAFVDPAVRLSRRYADDVVDSVMQDTGGYPFSSRSTATHCGPAPPARRLRSPISSGSALASLPRLTPASSGPATCVLRPTSASSCAISRMSARARQASSCRRARGGGTTRSSRRSAR